jgi:hypothetical protein
VVDEVTTWQSRPLDAVYPIVYLDCLHLKVREGTVRVKAVYLAIGVTLSGEKEVLGLWLAQTEGAKFWLQVITELKNRGVQDIFIACVDGLKGFPEAIETVFPHTTVQLCLVHMARHSLNYVTWKQHAEVAADLKRIYTTATVAEAEKRLREFEDKWDAQYPPISQSWRRNWERLIPFFDCKRPTDTPCSKPPYDLSGSSSSMRLFGQAGSFSRVSLSQAKGSMPFNCAVASKDWIAAARCPARSEPVNIQFFLPIAIGRMMFSTGLLSMGS